MPAPKPGPDAVKTYSDNNKAPYKGVMNMDRNAGINKALHRTGPVNITNYLVRKHLQYETDLLQDPDETPVHPLFNQAASNRAGYHQKPTPLKSGSNYKFDLKKKKDDEARNPYDLYQGGYDDSYKRKKKRKPTAVVYGDSRGPTIVDEIAATIEDTFSSDYIRKIGSPANDTSYDPLSIKLDSIVAIVDYSARARKGKIALNSVANDNDLERKVVNF